MKKSICKCLLACLLFVSAVVMINVPAYAAKKSSKSVPKTVVWSSYNDEGDLSPYTVDYKISYDKNGRVKKITCVSHVTDSSWSYSISYKKSGKKTKAIISYENSWGEEDDNYTYTFNSKGYLVSNNKSSKWKWDYTDETKNAMMVAASNNYILLFDDKGKYESSYYLKGDKVTSFSSFNYEEGNQSPIKVSFFWNKAVALDSITEEFLDKAESTCDSCQIKTTKVSMTNAVKWMNSMLLFDFVFMG